MAITHAAATRNSQASDILALIGTNGQLEFMTITGVEVVTLALSATAGVVTGPRLDYNAIASGTSTSGGTIARFRIKTSGGTEIYRGDVTGIGGGGDIELTSLVISANESVSISSLTYDAAP